MKRLHFVYNMKIDYSVQVTKCYFTIKCLPQNTARQTVDHLKISLFPEVPWSYGQDGFKNTQIYGVDEIPHTSFIFQISGDAEVGLSPYEAPEDPDLDMIYAHPHGLNRPGEKIRHYFESIPLSDEADNYKKAVLLMHRLHQDMSYAPCTTGIHTTAEEAFGQGHGVCQDYAHIYISLLHLAGIPARYVTGLLIGEGASHAWTEILWDGKWYGLDPTNDCMVSADHIRIGVGRDAADCMINRGLMHGGGNQLQTIRVQVSETE